MLRAVDRHRRFAIPAENGSSGFQQSGLVSELEQFVIQFRRVRHQEGSSVEEMLEGSSDAGEDFEGSMETDN